MSEFQSLRLQVGILCISTGKYKQFVPDLLNGLDKYFLPDHDLTLFLFTDEIIEFDYKGRVRIEQQLIPSYKFPAATLLRYRIFKSRKYYEYAYLYYIDVDMRIESFVGNEILKELVAVVHPGFYKGGGSWETRPVSETYVPPEKRKKYYAGGFQGGHAIFYYAAMLIMDDMIKTDEENGITPIWHDESAWNSYLSHINGVTELDPSYCMVEQNHLKQQWGISHFDGKIIAIEKDHKSIRE